MRNLLFIALLLFVFGCGGDANVVDYQSNEDLELMLATTQSWSAGSVGGNGKTITMELKLKQTQVLEFDSLWSKNPTTKLDITRKGGGEVTWEAGEEIQVYAVIYDNRTAGIPGPVPRATLHPTGYDGEALIRYHVLGKEGPRYIAVDEFEVLTK